MRTAVPVASILFAAALALAVVWQSVNLWRQPTPLATPMATPPVVTTPPANPGPSPVPAPPSQTATSEAAPPTPQVDETALRYFARQGDTRRLNAEIARLRSLYPSWTPPQDPSKAAPVADPQLDRMWELYAEGHFATVREAIAARESAEVGWVAPQDLLERLALADTRDRLVNASDAKQYGKVIEIGATAPSLRTCGDVDVLWRVAEAFVRTDRQARAIDVYRYILTNCTNEAERIATMQKAASLLPRQSLAPLFELGHAGAEADEFRSIGEDLARRAISEAGADPKAVASEEDVATVERLADAGHSVADPMLLGWYFLRRDEATQAEHWFRISYDRQNTAVSAQGLALALLKLKKPAEAEATMARWHDASDDAGKTYLAAATNLLAQQPPPVIAPDVLARIVETVVKRRDPAAAQELGWYSRALNQDQTAGQWFATALAWKPDDEPSAFGLAVVDSALQRRDALKALARVWGERSPRILALLEPAAAARAAQGQWPVTRPPPQAAAEISPAPVGETTPSSPARPASERVALRRAVPGTRSGCALEAGMTRAWCLMRLNRPAEAAAAFRSVLATGNAKERQDAAYGLSLANLNLGLTDEAGVAAGAAPQTKERMSEISLAMANQRILAAYNAGNYADTLNDLDARARLAPEPTDLMILRGWSYFHLQRYEEAERLFEALVASGHEEARAALNFARAKTGGPTNADPKNGP